MPGATPPISVFLIAKNEADRLPRTLDAARAVADEIILIDSGSTDGTREVAEAHGARVILNAPFPGYGEQKRFAEEQCRNDWLLNLDADEVVSDALAAEIRERLARDEADAYETPIVELWPGEAEPPPLAYRLYPVRLYRRSKGRYNPSPVHDRVDLAADARIARLRGDLLHYPIRSLAEQMRKLDRYTTMQADDFVRRRRRLWYLRLFVEFPTAFLKAWIGRRYVLRGAYGYLVAINYAYYRTMRLGKIYELERTEQRLESDRTSLAG